MGFTGSVAFLFVVFTVLAPICELILDVSHCDRDLVAIINTNLAKSPSLKLLGRYTGHQTASRDR